MNSFSGTIISLFLSFAVLFILGLHGVQLLLVTLGARKRRPIDISHLQLRPSDKLLTTVGILWKLGFERLGEARTKIGHQSLDAWVFVSADKSIVAELTDLRPKAVAFTTVYSDEAVVETSFPSGEKIETPYYRSHTITTSIEEAHSHQIKQSTEFGAKHGIPQKVETVKDYLYWDTVFREKYAWRKMGRFTWFGIGSILCSGYGVVTTLVITGRLLLDSSTWTAEWLYYDLLSLSKAIAPVVPIAMILFAIELLSNVRKSTPA